MARSVWLFLLFSVSAVYAEERCYTEAELEAEVGVGFMTGQGAGAFLCDKRFPDLHLFTRHQNVVKKFEPKFVGFSNVLASQFRRTWPETWKGRYEQYTEETG